MGERKVLNKYIPADFDPRLVPRGSKPKDDVVSVRMMLPFSIQCSSCSSFMYRGKKFNSKKENVKGSEGKYLGIQRFRFYIKCSVCSRPITFLTDPKKADYEMESGATRNYEVWHDKTLIEDKVTSDKKIEEVLDPMKALESRVLDSQREMADLDSLEDIKAMNLQHLQILAKNSKISDSTNEIGQSGSSVVVGSVLDISHGEQKHQEEINENGLTQDDEDLVRKINFGQNKVHGSPLIKRIDPADEVRLDRKRQLEVLELEKQFLATDAAINRIANASNTSKTKLPNSIQQKKIKLTSDSQSSLPKKVIARPHQPSQPDLVGLLGGYLSSSDSD